MKQVLLIDADILLDTESWLNRSLGYWMHGEDKYVHRTVASKVLGRQLTNKEIVHHVDYDKNNCKRNNLLICSQTYHMMIHKRWDAMLAGFDWKTHSLCSVCKEYHSLKEFAKSKNKSSGVHNICKEHSNRIRREKEYWRAKYA